MSTAVRRRLPLRTHLQRVLKDQGIYVKRAKNLPEGFDWMLDIQRLLPRPLRGVIFDVGAHTGETTLALRRYFPHATIHSFEPIPATFSVLQEATAEMVDVHLHQMALGRCERDLTIRAVPLATTNSLVTGKLEADPESEEVSIRETTVAAFQRQHDIGHISILKIDTERYEDAVIEGAMPAIAQRQVDTIVVEATFEPQASLQTPFAVIHDMLSPHGFLPIGFYQQETLRPGPGGSFCNVLFVHRDLMG